MRSRCGPPDFDEQDWSKFDFTRWHLDGLALDSAAAAFAGLSEKLFNSEEWRQHFQATLPELRGRALDFFKEHSQELRQQRNAAVEDFNNRAAAAQQRSDDFRKSVEAVGAPPAVEPSPDAFHASVRVVSQKDARLGLPSLAVQIVDPKNEKVALAESFTDNDGIAVITVPPELAKERDKRDMILQVLDSTGKPLAKLPNAVCVRLGQAETKVVKIAESPAIAEHQKLALEIRAERETKASHLAARSNLLRRELQTVLEELDCRLEDNEAILAELERPESTAGVDDEPATKVDNSSQPSSAKKEQPPTPQKRRKKS
jgi:hypothetical protein